MNSNSSKIDFQRIALTAVLVALAVSLVIFAFVKDLYFDDSYMFIRYAENLKNYHVFGWNWDHPAYGCTSVGYVFSNYILIKLGLLGWMAQSNFLMLHSLLYFFAGLFVIHRIVVKILTEKKSFAVKLSFCIIIFLMLVPVSRKNALTGMDTSMSFFANALLIYTALLFNQKNSTGRLLLFSFSAYFVFFVRPDNGIYSLLFPFVFLLKNQKRKFIIPFFVLLGIFYAIDFVVKYYYFGNILPIPYYVKSKNFYAAYLGIDKWNTWHYLAIFILNVSPVLLAGFFLFRKKQLSFLLAYSIPLCITCFFFMSTIPIMGYDSRLFMPSIPFVITILVIIVNDRKYELQDILSKWYLNKRFWVSSLVLLLAIVSFYVGGTYIYSNKKENAIAEAAKYRMLLSDTVAVPEKGWWQSIQAVNNLIPTVNDTAFVIAGSEHGIISSSNLRTKIVCLAGIHNLYSLKERSLNQAAIEGSLKDYKPDFIWMPHTDYVNVRYNILTLPSFREHYDFFNGILDYGIAIRKDSKYYNKIIRYFEDVYNIKDLPITKYNF